MAAYLHITEATKEIFTRAFDAHRIGNIADAERLYLETIAHEPGHFEAVNNLGVICIQQQRYDEAVVYFQSALDIEPEYPLAHANMGSALTPLGRPLETLWHCRRAHELNPTNTPTLTNMSDAFAALGRFKEMEAITLHALELSPAMPEALLNLGVAMWGLGDTLAASDLFERVRTMKDRGSERAAHNSGVIALARGDYFKGWTDYEARFGAERLTRRYTDHQQWDGSARPHGVLLVVAEQGIGDEILYASMMRDAAKRFEGAVIWEMDVRLIPLFEGAVPKVKLLARSLASPSTYAGVTHRCDLGGLGKFLRVKPQDFPGVPYITPTSFRMFGGDQPLRVGISWRSINTVNGIDKTVPLEHWRDVLTRLHGGGAEIVSLQYGETPELDAFPFVKRPDYDARFDLESLANTVVGCDHVVTVSNSTAHLAGACGVPTTVLLADGMGRYWYWGNGDTTPWYPKTKIVRQLGRAWPDVLETVRPCVGDTIGVA